MRLVTRYPEKKSFGERTEAKAQPGATARGTSRRTRTLKPRLFCGTNEFLITLTFTSLLRGLLLIVAPLFFFRRRASKFGERSWATEYRNLVTRYCFCQERHSSHSISGYRRPCTEPDCYFTESMSIKRKLSSPETSQRL